MSSPSVRRSSSRGRSSVSSSPAPSDGIQSHSSPPAAAVSAPSPSGSAALSPSGARGRRDLSPHSDLPSRSSVPRTPQQASLLSQRSARSGGSSPVHYSSPVPASPNGRPRSGGGLGSQSSVAATPPVRRAAAVNQRRGELGRVHPQQIVADPQSGAGAAGSSQPMQGVPSSDPHELSSRADCGPQAVVWGTTVNVQDTMQRFQQFFQTFTRPNQSSAHYMRVLHEMVAAELNNINLDCKELGAFDEILYTQLVRYPQEIIPIFDLVVNNLYKHAYPAQADAGPRVQVRTMNLREVKNMRRLNPSDIDQMVSIRGMIIRCSTILPDLRVAFFQCTVCEATEEVDIDRGRVAEPTTCKHCQTRGSLTMIHNRNLFADKQLIKVQETPESIPDGETPHTVDVYTFDSLVDVAKPGDRVEITGIYRGVSLDPEQKRAAATKRYGSVPIRVNPRKRVVKSIYKTYVDALHFKKTAAGRLGAESSKLDDRKMDKEVDGENDDGMHLDPEYLTEFEEGDMTEAARDEQYRHLRELSTDPDIYLKLARSLAPNIYELDDVKKGILCQLFGGTNKTLLNQSDGVGRFRGELNVLLCGDPGTSKSQLLQYVHKIAPRGIYTSGKGSSAVGLTAYITKDAESREMVLESGALVLSDRGICCIDEFDKMSESTRSILHEVMEQQTVSIAKAGIICTLNARTSILASANPVKSRYDTKLSVVDNIDLPPALMSRFDLIYLILDKPDERNDRRLAQHLVNLYYKEPDPHKHAIIQKDLLTQYISYGRKFVHPKLSDAAAAALILEYRNLRLIGHHAGGTGSKKIITATPRQLESLIRLSEAHAKIHFRTVVEPYDVAEACRLMKVALQQAATDPRTGLIDMGAIATGMTESTRDDVKRIADALHDLILNWRDKVQFSFRQLGARYREQLQEVAGAANRTGGRGPRGTEVSDQQLAAALDILESDSIVRITGDTKNPIIKRLAPLAGED